ncbi:hypothetical protein [Solilutibacter silvestris]|uniref:Methyltransferase domain-containing protein n=1 Tax=Solilutibacter silvestris TaxID=1645665 RepID=A0A2K1Q3M9_9GAMM|nr:hypothetical protein [Lysobacter silvestris]PNS09662.1 Methyltransferase domain-containing protein [Lysobacter silvestris]
MTTTRHLDLGCGKFPRNPYDCNELHGIDMRALDPGDTGFSYRRANVVVEAIPYPDDFFDSISAFDFIEHIPRVLAGGAEGTRLPFIELMNEIWRVLVDGGRFYAITPAWPHPEAFVDPTHVNFITEDTLTYFTGDSPLGGIYGFHGHFKLIRQDWVHPDEARNADADSMDNPIRPAKHYETGSKRLAQRFRRWSRRMRGKPEERDPPQRHWLRWELRAVKAPG